MTDCALRGKSQESFFLIVITKLVRIIGLLDTSVKSTMSNVCIRESDISKMQLNEHRQQQKLESRSSGGRCTSTECQSTGVTP